MHMALNAVKKYIFASPNFYIEEKDGRVISLIHKYMNAGVVANGMFERTEVGVPQEGLIDRMVYHVLSVHQHMSEAGDNSSGKRSPGVMPV